jgi:hypothetical protein
MSSRRIIIFVCSTTCLSAAKSTSVLITVLNFRRMYSPCAVRAS